MYNYEMLKNEIKQNGYFQKEIAKKIGIEPETFSIKMNNKQPFTQTEMDKLKKLLKLKNIEEYFFTKI